MSFPYMNAMSVSRLLTQTYSNDNPTSHSMLTTGQHNLFSVPGVVDVSAMEFSMSLSALASTLLTRVLASAASTAVVTFSDGGATGDATGAAVLFSQDSMSNSLTSGFEANVPLDVTGTSSTDLDADDWVNFRVVQNATGLIGGVNAVASYIYGKPGGIN
jgi:hypothetical protein